MSEPHAGIQSNAYIRKLLRQGWRTQLVLDPTAAGAFHTADILRGTQTSAGKPSAGVAPPTSTVSGLSGLLVVVDGPGQYDGKPRSPDFIDLRDNERLFTFLDVPATPGVALGTILLSDWVRWEGRVWHPTRVLNDLGIGLSTVRAELWVR